MKKIIAFGLFSLIVFSCSKKDNQSNENIDLIEYDEAKPSDNENTTNSVKTINQIAIKGNDDMTYSINSFTVKAGEEINISLVNAGTLSKEAMGHNIVILKQGTDVNQFAYEASSEKDNDYIPAKLKDQIIGHTKLLGPKETDQIKITFDKPGIYDYICTFPGHAAIMKGKITVI